MVGRALYVGYFLCGDLSMSSGSSTCISRVFSLAFGGSSCTLSIRVKFTTSEVGIYSEIHNQPGATYGEIYSLPGFFQRQIFFNKNVKYQNELVPRFQRREAQPSNV